MIKTTVRPRRIGSSPIAPRAAVKSFVSSFTWYLASRRCVVFRSQNHHQSKTAVRPRRSVPLRLRHGRRQKNQVFSSRFSSLAAMVPIFLKGILGFRRWVNGFARRFRQHPNLRARWLDQYHVIIFEFLHQVVSTA